MSLILNLVLFGLVIVVLLLFYRMNKKIDEIEKTMKRIGETSKRLCKVI